MSPVEDRGGSLQGNCLRAYRLMLTLGSLRPAAPYPRARLAWVAEECGAQPQDARGVVCPDFGDQCRVQPVQTPTTADRAAAFPPGIGWVGGDDVVEQVTVVQGDAHRPECRLRTPPAETTTVAAGIEMPQTALTPKSRSHRTVRDQTQRAGVNSAAGSPERQFSAVPRPR